MGVQPTGQRVANAGVAIYRIKDIKSVKDSGLEGPA
jgi:hypothetical protein